MKDFPVERCYFLDESGVNLAMTTTYALAPKGERALGKKPAKKEENMTVIGAIGYDGFMSPLCLDGASDGSIFLTYLKEELIPKLSQGDILFMDNVSFHKVEGIEEVLKEKGIILEYLPPYSPDLNPIEECWSKIKAILRKFGARTKEELYQALNYALDAITLTDIQGWFGHAGYCVASS